MSVSSLDFDDDFPVQPYTEAPYIKPEIPAPKGISTSSSIRESVPFALVRWQLDSERQSLKQIEIFKDQAEQNQSDIQKLNTEREEALKKEAEAYQSRMTWGTLATVSQYVYAISSIVTGSPLLIGAGVIALTNRVLHDTPLLEIITSWITKSEESQRKITETIESGAFYLQLGLGLAGGLWAWQTGAFAAARAANLDTYIGKATTILGAASGVVNAGARVTSEYYKKKSADYEAKLKMISGNTTSDQQTLTQETDKVERMIESAQSLEEQIKSILDAFKISSD